MMSQLSLRFLGTPEVRYGGQVLKFPTRKALALLVYLAVEDGLHTRQKLATLFWPESDVRRGQAALRNTLTRLRRTLRMAGPPLIIEPGLLGFDFNTDYELDLQTVARAVQTIQDRAQAVAPLQAAVDVCRGGFLSGFSLTNAPDFDNWMSVQREVWHRRIALVFDQLSQSQSEAGQIPQAIETAARWVRHDPLNEAACQRLMELHFAAGDRAAALQVYDDCRRILNEELGAEPAPETKALAKQIRDFRFSIFDEAPFGYLRLTGASPKPVQPSPRPKGVGSEAEGSVAKLSKIETPKLAEIPFVGRSREHARLVAAYNEVCRGQAQVVVIEGEAGIGKTRLATEFLAWAKAQGTDALRGRAFESGGRLPYQPVIDALRERIDQENAPDDLLSDTWLAELTRLLPELRDRYPDLPDYTREESLARSRLFESVARLGQALSQRRPVVILIDDAQWTDEASRDLLHYVSRRWSESKTPILLLLTARTEDLAVTPTVVEWLTDLRREARLTRLKLEPITVEDALKLVQTLAPPANQIRNAQQATRSFSQWLFDETAGHPFFMTETIKHLLERKLLTPRRDQDGRYRLDLITAMEQIRALGSASLPPGVREVILARLRRLSPNAIALLTAAAVIGRDCSFERLSRVSDIDPMAGLTALDELLASRLLLETENKLRPYTFAHDKIRDVVYTEAGDARRRIYHRRAFEVLEKAESPPAELAYHALAARLTKPAFQYSVTAGDEAMQLFAVRDAIAQYEQARKLEDGRQTSSRHQWRHLYTQLGRAFELLSNLTRAEAVYREMLALAQDLDYPEMKCAALTHLAFITSYQGVNYETFKKAKALLEQARTIAESFEDRLGLAETEWGLGQLGFMTGDVTAIFEHGGRALELARQLEQPELTARSLIQLAYGQAFLGHGRECVALLEEAIELYRTLGNRALEAECLGLAAGAYAALGQLEKGIAGGRTAYAISLEIENAWGQVHSAANLVPGLLDSGAYEEALQLAQEAVTIARSLDIVGLLHLSLSSLGLAHRALQAHENACKVHLEMARLNWPSYAEMDAADLCVDYALVEDWEQAYIYAQRALAHRGYIRLPHSPPIRWLETEALLRGGDAAAAREDAHRYGEQIGDNKRYRLPYLRCLAVLAQWEDDTDGALAHLKAAYALAEELGLPGEQWQILAALGALYRANEDEAGARRAFNRAAEIVRTLAKKISDEQLQAEFLTAEQVRRVLDR